ncbi:putative mucin TcMUCII [Trypanosoma cruzi]|uniref:Mucin TcMUCII, putative n=2 Tax=Trypanosoma cruzi TaxID=5693 RepID=Q4CUI5_TRYCC|nr:mucin TcMUCII, putative [Trypanosoma cruzi]EAN83936.1 mucin TcMUCII, putative [Trypanosoma cruzi]PWV15864.1 putative mucin TcMUCII [Trypanosoma cruzi]RNC33493.1 mucin TcMUCII [Trypanosoma cruzi]|eukprot:XP_805787.1 mucin TcMUCII [Trypanosoma cruzi strain CL Brener]
MMMTCRLLCALLLLALCCCCPSVCVTETQLKDNENRAQEKESGIQPPPPKPPTAMSVDTHDSVGSHSSTAKVVTVEGAAQAGSTGLGSSAELGMLDRDETRLSALEPQPDDEKNTVQAEGTKEQQSRTSTSAEQTNMESEAFAQTTTTTTKPPTTTSTTTTQAPSTTTTEAPTVSTTRAPSRFREIDGSLSSSAWVCAPLVLAASALAYTTVG